MTAAAHEDEFRAFISSLCATDPGPIVADGKWHRFRISDTRHKGSKPGRYLMHADGKANGIFMDWRDGTRHKWFANGPHEGVDRLEIDRRREARRMDRLRDFQEAADEARSFFAQCSRVSEAHPYLSLKGIQPSGTRVGSGKRFGLGDEPCVIIPLSDVEGNAMSLQAIRGDRERRYWPGSTTEGAHFAIGKDDGVGPVIFCEGFATAAQIADATGHLTIMCVDSGNMLHVGRWAGHRYAGRKLIVAGDDDWHLPLRTPPLPNAGREKATAMAKAIGGIAVFPNMMGLVTDGGDDFDDMARDIGRDDVAAVFTAALTTASAAEPPPPTDGAPISGERKKVRATPYEWQDPETIEPRDWLLGRLLLRGQAHGKVAPGGYGKTFHTVATALSLATGRPLLGHSVWGGPKKVWIWNLEDPKIELTRAIQAACKHWGIRREEIEGRLFVDCAMDGADLKIATATQANGLVMNRPLVEELVEELIDRGIDYLDVDPFVSSHGVDENDNPQIDAVTKEWSRVAVRSGTAIGITHHIKKLNGGEVTAEMARGAVSFVAALRSTFVMNRMAPEDASKWGISKEQSRRYVRVYDDKGNRAPPADKSDWYFLASVDLGNGPADGSRPSDNIAAMEPWQPPDAFTGITAEHLRRVQEAVNIGRWREDIQSNEWVGHAVGPIVGRVSSRGEENKADRAMISQMVKKWIGNGALVEVEGKDKKGTNRKWIECGDPVRD